MLCNFLPPKKGSIIAGGYLGLDRRVTSHLTKPIFHRLTPDCIQIQIHLKIQITVLFNNTVTMISIVDAEHININQFFTLQLTCDKFTNSNTHKRK